MDLQTKQNIDEIRRRYAPYDQNLPEPAKAVDVEPVAAWFQERYPGKHVPTWLTEVWSIHNGVEFDGCFIYSARNVDGIDDVREVNELYVDDYPDYFMFGHQSDVYMFAWRPSTGAFELLGVGDFEEPDETFDTFDGLFACTFGERLG